MQALEREKKDKIEQKRNKIAVFQRAKARNTYARIQRAHGANGGAFIRFWPNTITVQWFCARVMPL